MFTPEEDRALLEKASYAAYNEAIKAAFRALSDSIAEYLDEHRELYDKEILDVPPNFRPLKDYKRTLRIQGLTLRLVLKAAELSVLKVANSIETPLHTNGRDYLPAGPTLPT
jgi:hypothetical protein